MLSTRPREVHMGFPFYDHDNSHSVFDQEWLDLPYEIEFDRIQIPPDSHGILAVNWRKKFIFDFQLPPVDQV